MTIEQKRAQKAFEQVSEISQSSNDEQRKYRTITLKAQALIRNSGLCQALHFFTIKNGDRLVEHLEQHLVERGFITENDKLLSVVRTAPNIQYLTLMREILQTLTWQCRAVEALEIAKDNQ